MALQVRDLERSAAFYERELGADPPGRLTAICRRLHHRADPFAVREPLPGTDLDAGPRGLGVSMSVAVDDAQALHDALSSHGTPILMAPFDTPFGHTFMFRDPEGYAIAVHGSRTDDRVQQT